MALTINATTLSDLVTNNLTQIYSNISTSLERLSTGLRINSAQDDPAGLAVSEYMAAKIATLNQAESNAQDGVSLIQTAESGLAIIDEKLIRMQELAEQSATGTYTSSQRMIMQSEFTLMASEIDRIANSTDFNGIKLLDGSIDSTSTWTNASGWQEPDSGVLISVGDGGSRAEDYYYISIPDSRTTALFNNQTTAISTQAAATNALNMVETAIINKENARSWLGAMENRLEGTIDHLTGTIEALSDAESEIVDADFSQELTDYTYNLVLAQAATAMLAQANILPQMANTLLSSSL